MTPTEALFRLDPQAPNALINTFFEQTSVGLGILDLNCRFVWSNTAFDLLYGLSDHRTVGSHFQDVVRPNARHISQPMLDAVLKETYPPDYTTVHQGPSHQTVWDNVKTSYYPLRVVERVFAILLIVVDNVHDHECETKLVEQANLDRIHHEIELKEHLQSFEAKISEYAHIQADFLRDVLASVTDGKLRLCQSSADLPSQGQPFGHDVALTALSGLREIRLTAKSAAIARDFFEDRWQDLITATSEAGMNAIVHAGGGISQVFVGVDGCIQVWIVDTGKGIEIEDLPRATLERGYTTMGTMGHGMKLMLQTIDRLWLLTGRGGTTVVLEQDRESHKRVWT
jgi:anti-sigma regulatory factor (Ser/Thr protein kinase)